MDNARWKQIQDLFHQAADLPAAEQEEFLRTACANDTALLSHVRAMLGEDARRTSLLDRDLAHVAHEMFGEAAAPLPLREFGPYHVQRILGEGGMGIVYLAERQDLGNRVAIKLLRDAWLSPARRERFRNEQRTLAQLNHPSIARLYDADSLSDGTPWFAMEYVEGLPLTEYCAARGAPVRERLELFGSVCEAVRFAHSHAVIHRDLKPSNILVRSDGAVRLLDFGIAKQLESLDRPADQTRTGLRLMTPAYAAPEQIRGEPVGVHSDVYSLGVILYELLAGRLPFDLSNRTPAEAETILVNEEALKPSLAARRPARADGAGPGVQAGQAAWADLDVLCLTAMHKDPQRRYRSVEALIRDVEHFLRGEPLEARPDSLGYRLGKFIRRNRRAATATAAVLVAVISLVIFFTVRLAGARNEALAEAARTQRIQQFMLNLFHGGDASVGPAADLRVVSLLDHGVQEAQALAGEPAVQAELYRTLGDVYRKLGNFERAGQLIESSLERRRALFGSNHRAVAESLVTLGILRIEQARLEDAEQLVRDGLAMFRRDLPADHPDVANALASLGKVLQERGAYDDAIRAYEEAVRLHSRSKEPTPDLAESLSELANTHFYAGNYEKSVELNQQALEMDRRIFGDRHPRVGDTLISLGAVQFEWGRAAEAERYHRAGLEIIEAWYGPDHYRTAAALTVLARAIVRQERYEEGAGLLRRSLAIQERVHGPRHRMVASALNELGIVALGQNNLEEAEACFRRMAAIYRELYDDRHWLIAIALSNLSNVYTERRQYATAEAILRETVARFTESLSADHLSTGVARVKLGRILVTRKRYAQAEAELRAALEILMKQTTPPANWVHRARTGLLEIYEALEQTDRAEQVRAELRAAEAAAPPANAARE
jgi:serine/threonine protein kinase/tetratricopeptide (TPR) repeat protein